VLGIVSNSGANNVLKVDDNGLLTVTGGFTLSGGTLTLPADSVVSSMIAASGVATKHFTLIRNDTGGASATRVADCGSGKKAIAGGGSCTASALQKASCPCTTSTCTDCSGDATFQQFWLLKCDTSDAGNLVFALCVSN